MKKLIAVLLLSLSSVASADVLEVLGTVYLVNEIREQIQDKEIYDRMETPKEILLEKVNQAHRDQRNKAYYRVQLKKRKLYRCMKYQECD
jgi:hypothetical protein